MEYILKKILKNPKKVLLFYLFSFLISLFTIHSNLKINTSTDSLINKNLDFKLNQQKLKKSFRVLNNNILIRIKGNESNQINLFGEKIITELKSYDGIDFVYSPSSDKFFKENFFLFLNDLEKENLIQKIYNFQPFLSQINNHQNKLEGFNSLLELSLKENSLENLSEFSNIFERFTLSLKSKEILKWNKLLSNDEEIFILLGVNQKYLDENGFYNLYNNLDNLKLKFDNTIIDFTGGLIIDYEEVKSVASGSLYSGLLSFILVGFLLWFAFKNIILISSILLTILIGLIITLGITSISIGSLNLISVAFAVLFIGLSVDYGIQVCSRYREDSISLKKNRVKKFNNLTNISKTLTIVAVPSIIGFMSFVPTDYKGLSELGMISAIGLVIGLVLNLSLLPCLIIVWSSKVKRNLMSFGSEKLINFVLNNQKKILITFFIIFIFTLLNFKNVKFDSDALNLKDQKLQSVKLAKELIEKNPTSDYVVSLIFDEKDFISFGMSHPIFRNENVKSYFSFNNIISKYESDDLDYLKFLLSRDSFLKTDSNKDEITKFKLLLDQFIIKNFNPLSENAYKLKQELNNLEKERYSSSEIKNLLFEGFDDLIYFISNIDSIPDNVENLVPKSFKQRYISEDNLYRIEIFPSKDLSKPENLENFVKIIESYFPNATGMPIIQYNAGKVVSESFIKAFIISIIFLIIYLIFIFKKILYIIFCVGALVCAFILSIFFMIILNIDLNFANMIAIPLLFSLGVSYPLYLLRRFQEVGDVKKIYQTNTPSAILYSGLTTIFSFGTLYISPHNGTSSMGLLLFLCLLNTLISCLILLPIALNVFKNKSVFK